MRSRACRERRDDRHELRENALGLHEFVARVQRRELDRDRRLHRGSRAAVGDRRTDRIDRAGVRVGVAARVGRRVRGLAEHVVRVAGVRVRRLAGARDRFGDRAAHHELVGHQFHRATQRDAHDRLAEARDQALVACGRVLCLGVAEAHELAGQHERPRPGVDQHRVPAEMPLPVAARELVADEPVGGRRIGNAQQRLGDAHQQHPFVRAEAVFGQELLDAGGAGPVRAHAFDPRGRLRGDGARRLVVRRGLRGEALERAGLVGEEGGADRSAVGIGREHANQSCAGAVAMSTSAGFSTRTTSAGASPRRYPRRPPLM
jgi:hypothetical protein